MQTTVKFDSLIEFPPIVDPLVTPQEDEMPGVSDGNGDKQTKMTGIISPLIKLNNTTIAWSNVVSMSLTDNVVPKISLQINDKLDLQRIYDKPDVDNRLQLQILPPFDNAYKKINLMFNVNSIIFNDGEIYIDGTYNVPGWNNSVMKSFGYISTYEFFENVAHLLKMGYCSNMDKIDDKRWIYIPNTNINNSLISESTFGGNSNILLDYWVDYWNHINLVDIRDRYENIDEDISVWVQSTKLPETEGIEENPPQKIEAMITNHPAFKMNQLYTNRYQLVSNFSKNIYSGTDKLCEVYNMGSLDTESYLIMDGNVKKNIVLRYNYLGEEFGDVNYLSNSAMRESYMQKMNSQQIRVILQQPCLGLIKGGKVNFYWYETNEFITEELKEGTNETNIPLPDDSENLDARDNFVKNPELSGQYYITECDFEYENYGNLPTWRQVLLLSRKADNIEKLVTEEDRPIDHSSFDEQPENPSTEQV